MNDRLSESTLTAALSTPGALTVQVLESTDSTNADARRAFLNGANTATLIAANSQTAGRGRMGRQFFSPSGAGAYFSLLLPLSAPPSSILYVTCAAGVAVRRGILQTTGQDVQIKWVNDLQLGGKKVCGILAEALSMGDRHALIVGIGVNLHPIAFPPELEELAASLNCSTCTRSALIAACTQELLAILQAEPGAWLAEYRAHSCTLGRHVRILQNGSVLAQGTATDVRADGALCLRTDSGEAITVTSGEVSLR